MSETLVRKETFSVTLRLPEGTLIQDELLFLEYSGNVIPEAADDAKDAPLAVLLFSSVPATGSDTVFGAVIVNYNGHEDDQLKRYNVLCEAITGAYGIPSLAKPEYANYTLEQLVEDINAFANQQPPESTEGS